MAFEFLTMSPFGVAVLLTAAGARARGEPASCETLRPASRAYGPAERGAGCSADRDASPARMLPQRDALEHTRTVNFNFPMEP